VLHVQKNVPLSESHPSLVTMQILTASLFATAALATSVTTGQLRSTLALKRIMERQVEFCSPVSVPSCSESCGAGYVTCISWPTCYNPGNGETCCSDGSYCPAGSYCTDAGCCPEGTSLEECGATEQLSTVAPPAATSYTTAAPATTSAVQSYPVTTPAVTSTYSPPAVSTPASNATVAPPSPVGPSAVAPSIAVGAAGRVESAAAGFVLSCVCGLLLL